MGRYYGKIGFKSTVEKRPGVFVEDIIERTYSGDYMRNKNSQTTSTDKVNDDIRINHNISIVADEYIYNNFYDIKYMEVMGQKWKVTNVEVQRPRLILTTGGLYNEDSN